jgi:hypothetical protein
MSATLTGSSASIATMHTLWHKGLPITYSREVIPGDFTIASHIHLLEDITSLQRKRALIFGQRIPAQMIYQEHTKRAINEHIKVAVRVDGHLICCVGGITYPRRLRKQDTNCCGFRPSSRLLGKSSRSAARSVCDASRANNIAGAINSAWETALLEHTASENSTVTDVNGFHFFFVRSNLSSEQ